MALSVQCAREIISLLGVDGALALERGLELSLRQACAMLSRPIARVHIEVVGDERMTALHARFSNLATVTDVLTFPASRGSEPIDVDIAVCYGVAHAAAAERGWGVERELLLYALHGVLHCAGFDDHDESEHRRMHEEEDRILDALGVGRTFRHRVDGEAPQ